MWTWDATYVRPGNTAGADAMILLVGRWELSRCFKVSPRSLSDAFPFPVTLKPVFIPAALSRMTAHRATEEEPMPIDSVATKSFASTSVQEAVAHARISQAAEDVEKHGDEKTHEKSLDTLNEIVYVCDLSHQQSFLIKYIHALLDRWTSTRGIHGTQRTSRTAENGSSQSPLRSSPS